MWNVENPLAIVEPPTKFLKKKKHFNYKLNNWLYFTINFLCTFSNTCCASW